MPRDARKYLFDIAEAAKLISEFVAGKTLDDYLKSALLQSGVERQFEIIGEALGQLAKVDQQLASRNHGLSEDRLLSQCPDPWIC